MYVRAYTGIIDACIHINPADYYHPLYFYYPVECRIAGTGEGFP